MYFVSFSYDPEKNSEPAFLKHLLGKMVQLTQKLQECTMIKATLNCSVLFWYDINFIFGGCL